MNWSHSCAKGDPVSMADLFAGFTTFLFTFDSGGVKMSGGANREQPMTAFSLCAHTVLEDTCRFLASRLLRCRNSRRDDASASVGFVDD